MSASASTGVQIRDVEDMDLEPFFVHQRDPEATRMASFPARDREAFFAHWRKIRRDQTGVVKTVVTDGQVAGNVVSWQDAGRRLVGYWIGREYWGRGIATQALALLLQHLPERPLYAHVSPHNHGSIRVLEKCGFRLEPSPAADGVEDLIFVLAHPAV